MGIVCLDPGYVMEIMTVETTVMKKDVVRNVYDNCDEQGH